MKSCKLPKIERGSYFAFDSHGTLLVGPLANTAQSLKLRRPQQLFFEFGGASVAALRTTRNEIVPSIFIEAKKVKGRMLADLFHPFLLSRPMRTSANSFTDARPLKIAAADNVLVHCAGVVVVLEQRPGEVEGVGWMQNTWKG